MAYYNKQEVLNYVSACIIELTSIGLKPLNPEAEVIKRLNDEEDLVGFFWVTYEISGGDGEKIKMEGKSWYRVSSNLYTDDRFAIDLYQAMKAGLNVTDIIKKREIDKELAIKSVVDLDSLEKAVEGNTAKNGD